MASDFFMSPDYGFAHMGSPIGFSYRAANVDCMKAGQRIKAFRKAKELTQAQLAEAIGIDQSSLSDIERHEAQFGAGVLMRLCDELEVSAEMLMRGIDPVTWPFARLPVERVLALKQQDRDFIEGRLIEAIDRLPDAPPFESVPLHGTVRGKTRKRA